VDEPRALHVSLTPPSQTDPVRQANQAIDLVRRYAGEIISIAQQRPTLDEIFDQIVNHPPVAPPSEPIPAAAPVAVEADDSPRHFNSRLAGLRAAAAFLLRDFRIEVSYRFAFFLQFFGIFFSVVVFYFVSRTLGAAAAPYLQEYGGDYFSFVLIGIAFASYFGVGLSAFASNLRQAQTTGTLEAMLGTPTRLSVIILSSAVWEYVMTTLRVLVFLGMGVIFLNVDLGAGNYPAAGLILLLTILIFSSIGILAASFVMVLKRGDPVTWAIGAVSSLFGGVYFPISVLPGWTQVISRLLPITYALNAMRLALLRGAGFEVLWPDLAALALFAAALLPLSLLSFRYAVRRARREGSLTQY
jgi:ABC-2 type transport system permease protein